MLLGRQLHLLSLLDLLLLLLLLLRLLGSLESLGLALLSLLRLLILLLRLLRLGLGLLIVIDVGLTGIYISVWIICIIYSRQGLLVVAIL